MKINAKYKHKHEIKNLTPKNIKLYKPTERFICINYK